MDGQVLRPNINCLAAFFENHDVRNGGHLYYNVYQRSVSSNHEAADIFAAIENLVQDKYSINFHPMLVVKATWEEIYHYEDLYFENVRFYDDPTHEQPDQVIVKMFWVMVSVSVM